MICRLVVENFETFLNKIEIDFQANGNIKRFNFNYIKTKKKNILKVIGIYGPNNTGKTCLFRAFKGLRALMLAEPHEDFSYAFSENNPITTFEIEYYINKRFYTYKVAYNNKTKLYESEELILNTDEDNKSLNKAIFKRKENNIIYDKEFKIKNYDSFSRSFPVLIILNDLNNEFIKKIKKDYIDFANSLLFIEMNQPIDITKTINFMQKNEKARKFIQEFVKNCDLHIEEFGFNDSVVSDKDLSDKINRVISSPSFSKEFLKFSSKHNGYRVPSIFFESVGTMKLIALSGYIYDTLYNGKTLFIDEIESSLHHIITRSIASMFNNLLNTKAQLVFTTHDVLLLNFKQLFRKDQIYLIDLTNINTSIVKRMSNFTSRDKNGIRGDEDISEYYLKGQFGAIPSPDLFSSLEEINNE